MNWRTLRDRFAFMSATPSTRAAHKEEKRRMADAGRPAQAAFLKSVLEDRAVLDPDHAMTALGDSRVVGDDGDGVAGRVHLVEDPEDLVAGPGVEVPGRLVRQDEARVHDDGPGDRHPLPLSAREFGGSGGGAFLEPHPGERHAGALAPFGSRKPRRTAWAARRCEAARPWAGD